MHHDLVEQVKDALQNCKCVEHCDIGGARPDLTCVCSVEPFSIIEVETPRSLNRTHTKKQISIMSRRAGETSDQYAVIVVDENSMCGLPLNEEGEQLLREHNIPDCLKRRSVL